MGKTAKISKAAKKRFKITANDKLLRRAVGQNHFNAKDSGDEGRSKRQSQTVTDSSSISSMKDVMMK